MFYSPEEPLPGSWRPLLERGPFTVDSEKELLRNLGVDVLVTSLWQFIPTTGKRYNLDQNWWKDERRDIIASTAAALEYLQEVYEMHGDWHLALASYNWGEGAVARAIAKNKALNLR